jgi:channel protein (hemolysin III family)
MQVDPLPGFFEPVSALTHLVGAATLAVLAVVLIRRGYGDAARVALLGVFAASSVLLLSVSAVHHMLPEGSGGRYVMGRLDGAAIFVLIAGTHTAMHGLFFQGFARWGALILMWASTAAAISVFAVFSGVRPGIAVTIVYVSLGWTAGVSGIVIWRRFGTARIVLPLFGGAAYTVGTILLALRWSTLVPGVIGPHEVWHVAVLVGLLLHWSFVFQNAGRSLQVPAARRESGSPSAPLVAA